MKLALQDAATLFTDGDWVESKDQDPNGDVRLIQLADIGIAKFIDKSSRFLTSETAKRLRCTYLAPGDLLIARMPDPIGRACIFPDLGRKCVTAVDVSILRPADGIDVEFLMYRINSPDFRGEVLKYAKGATRKRISRKNLGTLTIDFPSLEEQRRIVARIKECMERVEEIEGLRAEAIEDSEYLPSAVFADYVESLNHSELGDSVLGDVVTECKYGTSKKANTSGKGCPVLRMGNIQAGRLDISDLKHIALPKTERKKYLLQEGDILINRTNSLELVGKSAVFTGLSGDWVYASYLIRLRIDPAKALPQYVNAVINSRIGRGYVYRTARRAIGMVNINAKEIQRMPLPLPPLDEQAALIEKMNEAAPLIDKLTSLFREDGISHLRESILRKAFAGEL